MDLVSISNSHFRFIFFSPFCPQLSSGGLHTDLGALSVHIEESVAGLRDISGRHPLVVAVNVNVQAVLTIHQHPYPAPAPHRGQVTAVVLLHLHAKPSQGAGDASGKKKFWCVSAVHSQNIAGTHVGVLHNFQTSNLLTSRRRSWMKSGSVTIFYYSIPISRARGVSIEFASP